jgi:magnesium-transporting ATPase (P-type)
MLKSGWKTNKFSPFDPVSKRITAEVENDGKRYTCAKGAPNAYAPSYSDSLSFYLTFTRIGRYTGLTGF